jgi:predicted GNAT family acetyltransferase
MYLAIDTNKSAAWNPNLSTVDSHAMTITRLTMSDEREVLAYLSNRPAHTFALAGFIRDNGLTSPLNRGKFYGCRDVRGQLEGVALIGHAILFETTDDAAIGVFARLALSHREAFIALAERDKIDKFCQYYSKAGQAPRLICREILLELRGPVVKCEAVPGLRKANLGDLDMVVNAHAELGRQERGLIPLETDPAGFRERCAKRIERGRTWVWTEGQTLIFKADVVSTTPEVSYLEGVWVDKAERSKGYGLRCLSQLSETLLKQTSAVCLLANDERPEAQRFYLKAGYKPVDRYETVYL